MSGKPKIIEVNGSLEGCRSQCAQFETIVGISQKGLEGSIDIGDIMKAIEGGVGVFYGGVPIDKLPTSVLDWLKKRKITEYRLLSGNGAATVDYMICANAVDGNAKNGSANFVSSTLFFPWQLEKLKGQGIKVRQEGKYITTDYAKWTSGPTRTLGDVGKLQWIGFN